MTAAVGECIRCTRAKRIDSNCRKKQDRSFKRLAPEVQAAVLEVAARAEARGWELAQKAAGAAVQALDSNGIKVVKPDAQKTADFQRVSDKIITEWAGRAGEDGKQIRAAMRGR